MTDGIYQEVFWCELHQDTNDGCPDVISIGWWTTYNLGKNEQEQ